MESQWILLDKELDLAVFYRFLIIPCYEDCYEDSETLCLCKPRWKQDEFANLVTCLI